MAKYCDAKFGGNWTTNKGEMERGPAYMVSKDPSLNRVKDLNVISFQKKVKPLYSGHLAIADTFLGPDGVRYIEVSLYFVGRSHVLCLDLSGQFLIDHYACAI